jgi:hypothetical protein
LKEAGFRLHVSKKKDAEVARPKSMMQRLQFIRCKVDSFQVARSRIQFAEVAGYKTQRLQVTRRRDCRFVEARCRSRRLQEEVSRFQDIGS